MNIRRFVFRAVPVLIALSAVAVAKPARAQMQTDVIRGRVIGPDTMPIYNVTVTATSYQGNVTKSAKTDKKGHFQIIFVNGEGDYWLNFTALGFVPKRFEIKKVQDEEIMLADTKMASNIATLDAVNVTANPNRALINRNANTADVGGGDKNLGAANNLLPPDQAGNLAAMAASIPGIQLIPGMDGAADMFSALGLGGDQNSTTFNGLGSGISTLPPDAQVGTSFNQQAWDVSSGGYSGAQIRIQTLPGQNVSNRLESGRGTGPTFEWVDADGDSTGQKSTTLSAGGTAAGPIVLDNAFYNTSYNFQRKFKDALTLLNTSPVGLNAAGVSADSVTRLINILHGKNVPVSVANQPSLNATDQAQLQANIDLVPSSSGTGNAFTLGLLGNYVHAQPIGGGGSLLTSDLARTDQFEQWTTQLSLGHSNYFGFGILSKTTLGYSDSHQVVLPFLNYPQGTVFINSDLPDGSQAVKPLFFGGGTPTSSNVDHVIALNNSLSWYSENNHHAIKLTSYITHEDLTADQAPTLGSFTFNSLADLESGTPASYSRVLSPVHAVTSQLTGGMSLGDFWRPKPEVQVTYGIRADANKFLDTPSYNASLDTALGIRNDAVPNQVYFSPRAGVQWTYGKAPQIAYAPGAARPPLAVIHFGAGIFQNVGPASMITSATGQTGLANSVRTITCIGPAAPTPDWDGFLTNPNAIPSQCADGTAGTPFANGAPSVVAFDKNFKQPASLRTAGDWSSPVLDNRFVLGLQGIYSWNYNQTGLVDLNFNPTERFSLANEDNRPVFADPSAIVTTTGGISSTDTRVAPAFSRVNFEQSTLNSASTQFTFSLKPVTANQKLKWVFTYTLLNVDQQFYGFSSTAGNPFDKQWGPSLASGRHQFQLTWNSFPIFDLIFVSAQFGVKSGALFTPTILGDVNGDGSFNDRAFVFDPSKTADPTVAADMRSLLSHGAPAAKSCLERQLNTLASRGSCQAPWVATGGLSIQFNPQKIGLPKRATIQLTLTNPLVLADLALHGSAHVKGWGQEISPDQNLLFVEGFDPVNKQFKYAVNQRFGSTTPQQAVNRAPAYASFVFKYDIGAPREKQFLDQRLDMGRGRPGTKQPAASMKQFGSASIPNPMAIILQQPDSLKLTRKQADSLASLSRKFTLHADSIWTPVAKYLEALPNDYNHGDAYDHYVHAREQTVDYLLKIVPDVKGLLTASQKRKLPQLVTNYLDERVLKFLRSSSAGNGSMYFF